MNLYKQIMNIKEIKNNIDDYIIGTNDYWKYIFNQTLEFINIHNSSFIKYGNRYKQYNLNHINNIKNNIIFIVGPKIKFRFLIQTIRLYKHNNVKYYVYIIHILILDTTLIDKKIQKIRHNFLNKFQNNISYRNTSDIRKIIQIDKSNAYKDLFFNIYLKI